ncbi:hypothetical protein AVEN_8177-1 [Araneus ventricosus]|uniref:Uncharacterized protein n=1 Tax=Araneus ventricosus TaxID=182803 RepID=A0A4Y2PSV0_ARAVE|nr:hypothetical protein AVEN_8177-1 [Araneus ventricosus]
MISDLSSEVKWSEKIQEDSFEIPRSDEEDDTWWAPLHSANRRTIISVGFGFHQARGFGLHQVRGFGLHQACGFGLHQDRGFGLHQDRGIGFQAWSPPASKSKPFH